MFKNVMVYRIGPDWSASLAQMEEQLQKARFVACGASQQQAVGWVEPRGIPHAPLVESIGGHLMLRLMIETKMLPASVVKRRTDERLQQIEKSTGRKPGKKETREIKESVVLELLPMAFTKQASVNVWIDPMARLLVVDAGSQAKADEVVTCLVKSLAGMAVTQVQTTASASAAMSEWLASAEAPAGFTVDRECELKAADETQAVVKYSRHLLDTDEVRQHIASGKQPTRLAMTWDGRVSFLLTDNLQIKKLSFLDVVFEGGRSDGEDGFDTDAAIATGEMSKLIPDLIGALGGERVMA